jgi:glutamate-5-semialdehyde dehydrogenase
MLLKIYLGNDPHNVCVKLVTFFMSILHYSIKNYQIIFNFENKNDEKKLKNYINEFHNIFTKSKDDISFIEKAKNIIIDAKTQYPSACNAVETILVHKNFKYKEELKDALIDAGIEIVFTPESWHKEYGEKKLSYKEVSSLEEAIEHINEYSSGHTESIITESAENAKMFMNSVDSSGVYHNVSTRFADGFRYGFGAEVGISTNKTHARGPVGLEGLTIYKYKLHGKGQIVDDYAKGLKQFHHRDIL